MSGDEDNKSIGSSSPSSDEDSTQGTKPKRIIKRKGKSNKKHSKKPKDDKVDAKELDDAPEDNAQKEENAFEDDDDAFIDNDDDDEEIVQDYKKQREFASDDDMDPGSDESDAGTGSKRRGPRGAVVEGPPETGWQKDIKALKPNRSRKEPEDKEKAEVVSEVVKKMRGAAREDDKCVAELKPALHKLNMLPEVLDLMRRQYLYDVMLEPPIGFDYSFLGALALWLRPNRIDKSFPAQTIRNEIYKLLDRLPIDKHHLMASRVGNEDIGLGSVISYMCESPKELVENKKFLRKMIQKWSEKIYKKEDRLAASPSKPPPQSSSHHGTEARNKPKRVIGLQQLAKSKADLPSSAKKKEAEVVGSYRAAIPRGKVFDISQDVLDRMKIMSKKDEDPDESRSHSQVSKDNRKELEKRMFNKRKR